MTMGVNVGAAADAGVFEVDRMAPIEVLVGSERFPNLFARSVGVFALGCSALSLLALALPFPAIPEFHPGEVASLVAFGTVLGIAMVLWPRLFSPTLTSALVVLGSAVIPVVTVVLLGPRVVEAGVAPMVMGGALCPLWFGRWRAWVPIALIALCYGAVMAAHTGYPGPASRWLVVVGCTVVTASLTAWVMGLARRLAAQQQATHRQLEVAHSELASTHRELAELNHTLESRVHAQVSEIEGLNRLRRFLSPQVAEAVLSRRDEAILEPHRRQIAVLFCDLRGFTIFSGGAEPEEVVEALDEYYRVVGEVLLRYDATVGTFAGDGIMAYLNDPVACEDPPGKAVEMAMALREPMERFLRSWQRRGFELGYGVGIAYGYATLGTIGFEGRNDYTALGSVVNLAARLCGEAASGQVLVDGRTAEAVSGRFRLAEREVVLKGFPTAIRANEVVATASPMP